MTTPQSTPTLVGTWQLQLSTPFGQQPVTLTVEQTGSELRGTFRHERGAAEFHDISTEGAQFTGVAAITLQGREITADVTGQVEGDQMSGALKVHLPIAPPVKFVGTRAQ